MASRDRAPSNYSRCNSRVHTAHGNRTRVGNFRVFAVRGRRVGGGLANSYFTSQDGRGGFDSHAPVVFMSYM